MGLLSVISMWIFTILSIVLTEVMLSSKNRSKNDTSKKIIFWIVTVCITLCLCGLQYFGAMFGGYILPVPLVVAISIFPLLMIPVRVVFELVLIGLNIERSITSSNNQSERQSYRSNYTSNTQNNN